MSDIDPNIFVEKSDVSDAAAAALRWAFAYHYNMDMMNSASHLSEVRFSRLTFLLAEAMIEQFPHNHEIQRVLGDRGQYPYDMGRP